MADYETQDVVTTRELRFERLLDAPRALVWKFLIDPELRTRWFMGGPVDARPGGSITFTMQHDRLSDDATVKVPDRYAKYLGNSWEERIIRCEPSKLLEISWEEGRVLFELSDVGDRTRLVLTHTGLTGRDQALNFGGGWHSHLAALERRLSGEGVANFWILHEQSEALVTRLLG